jgi:hypothetical protein
MDDVAIDLTAAQIEQVEQGKQKLPIAALDAWWQASAPNSALSQNTQRYNEAFKHYQALRACFS